MKVGVVVGRFQTYSLHPGHIDVLKKAIEESDTLLVLIGSVWKPPSHNNPLPFEVRNGIVRSAVRGIFQRTGEKPLMVMPIADVGNNNYWVKNLDLLVQTCFASSDVTFYVGKNSGMGDVYKKYQGLHKIEVVESANEISATQQRESLQIPSWDIDAKSVIWTTQSQYPKVYPTVDCILKDQAGFILLIKKANEPHWRFPGGFVDPFYDLSYESAVRREVREECGDIEITDPQYLGSVRVDDPRYKNEKDRIFTALYRANVMFGLPKAGDDAAQILGFAEGGVMGNLMPEHRPLWERYELHLKNR